MKNTVRVIRDAHLLGEQVGGNETDIRGLLSGFTTLTDRPDIYALHRPGVALPSAAAIHSLPRTQHSNWRRLPQTVPAIARRLRVDLVHGTYIIPFQLPCPAVVTVHDISFRTLPAAFTPRVRLLFSTQLPLSLARAHRIITISEAGRRDLEHFSPCTRGRIAVIPPAAGHIVHTQPDQRAARHQR